MKLILFDIIGAKSGCKYYDEVFYKQLKNHSIDAELHSNFSINSHQPSFGNIYTGNKWWKLWNFAKLIPTYIRDLRKNKNNWFVYLSYGEIIDLILLFILTKIHSKPIIDTHEFMSLDHEGNKLYEYLFKLIYKKVSTVIFHSERSRMYLDKIGYNGKKLFVPLFKQNFSKEYDITKLSEEIKKCISDDRINILFFGHMRESKGIFTTIQSLKICPKEVIDKFHFIFAGADPKSIMEHKLSELSVYISKSAILRFIQDEELNFLFDNVDIILLPYKIVSQSAVLETSVYFKKIIILSDIDCFIDFNKKYPSFSYIVSKDKPEDFIAVYKQISENGIKQYKCEDINKFYRTDLYDEFFNKLLEIVSQN